MSKRSNCRSKLQLSVGNEVVILEVNVPHDSNSHKEQTQHRLSLEAQHEIRECEAVDVSMTSTAIRRVISRNSEEVDVRNHQRVWRMVKNARSDVMLEASPLGKGFPYSDNIGDVRRYASDHAIRLLLNRHNAAEK